MDVHDIRYLHDDSVSEDDELGDDFSVPKIFTKKNIIGLFVIGTLITSIGLVTANISKETTTTSSAKTNGINVPTPVPTVMQVKVEGTVKCLASTPPVKNECIVALESPDGKTYLLQNVQYLDVVNGTLVSGNKVVAQGIITQGTDGETLYVTSVGSTNPQTPTPGTSSSSTKTNSVPTPTATITLTPTLTTTPTVTLTPTPIPHFVDSTPQPGVSYVTIQYIRDHAAELNGTQVNVGAYLVGGYIGEDGCLTVGICTYSDFFLADSNDPNRDYALDMQMIGSASEKEEDYTTGQSYYHKVTVVVVNSDVSLEKVY
ncbi:MAG: hypothetical protein Q8Q49_01775 [bacterium]|nr:hypothetical protein [bacterium]